MDDALPPDLAALEQQLSAPEKDARSLAADMSGQREARPAAPGAWNVAECLDHLAISNRVYLRAMEVAAVPGAQPGAKAARSGDAWMGGRLVCERNGATGQPGVDGQEALPSTRDHPAAKFTCAFRCPVRFPGLTGGGPDFPALLRRHRPCRRLLREPPRSGSIRFQPGDGPAHYRRAL